MSKLILTHEISGLGSAGDVVDVKNGYARNYLVPYGYAVAWTRGGQKQVEQIKTARSSREHATIEEAQHVKTVLEANRVTIAAKVGAGGRLFGSVTTSDIVEAVALAKLGTLDKRTIEISAPIKSTGDFEAILSLRDGISAVISLHVVADK
jgi:large subunit ribosomal protein L9